MVSNFDFLKKDFPVLSNFGKMAEKYCYSDSNSCLMKLGMIGETIVNLMFTYDRIAFPHDNTAVARIDTLSREGLLTSDLVTILHGLRKVRNKAVHENYASIADDKIFLPMAHSLCEWFMQTYGDWNYSHRDFVMPEENTVSGTVDKEAEEKKESELTKLAEQMAAAAPIIEQTERKKQAYKAANQRPKTEAETRFLIDEQLRMVGWDADTENLRYSKGTRPTKGRNLAIAEYPTNSKVGNRGYADYALFVGEKLVGIIEAKAIHKDIPSVIDYQGKDYPRCIRKEDEKYVIDTWGEFKVPFTFATNGRPYLKQYKTKSGIWFLDLRKPDNSPMPLRGWMSPDGMEELLAADIEGKNKNLKEMSYDLLTDKDGLNLRPYQLNAIRAAEEAVINGKQTALLAMATGTGKTRTVLGMIYRFLKTERFRRILFLVDRTALGEQAQDVFEEVKMEDLLTLDDIYNIKGLEDKTIDKETRIHISTVQGMVKRIMYNDGETMPAVSDYDLLIIDEAHRGYILDKEMGEDEALYRDQREYQSKYRSVIEYFNAVKIALTATPALQTTEIFGEPVFKYTYREAVIEGYLVDHDAPHELKTKLNTEGIHYKKGDAVTIYDPITGEIENSELIEDELDFDVDSFNKQVIVESFNRTVLEEIAKNIDPESPREQGKTLIYAVNDDHADMIVSILKDIYTEYLEYLEKPQLRLKAVKIQQKSFLENVISNADYKFLKNQLKKDNNMEWYFVVWYLAATGARVSELIRIKIEHVQLGYFDLYSKGGKLRRLFIPKILREETLKWLCETQRTSGYLFLNRYGDRITTRGISQQLKNYADKYGLDSKVVYPHSFRHRYAKNFLEKYNDIALLADLMGHESIETTRIYLRRTASEQQALVDKIVTW